MLSVVYNWKWSGWSWLEASFISGLKLCHWDLVNSYRLSPCDYLIGCSSSETHASSSFRSSDGKVKGIPKTPESILFPLTGFWSAIPLPLSHRVITRVMWRDDVEHRFHRGAELNPIQYSFAERRQAGASWGKLWFQLPEQEKSNTGRHNTRCHFSIYWFKHMALPINFWL